MEAEPWLVQKVVQQHLESPAMWSIFQLQDLLGMDASLRRASIPDERINIPAIPNYYWRYRMHRTLEHLSQAGEFNARLRQMLAAAGRQPGSDMAFSSAPGFSPGSPSATRSEPLQRL
jgi:4-alpha-glucanotransferase